MRALVGIGLALALTGVAAGEDKKDDKIDGKKLVGKWEQVAPADAVAKVTVEYTAGGTLSGTLVIGEKTMKVTGTYKLDGNKLTQTIRFDDDKDDRMTVLVITKLTDEVLESTLMDKPYGFKRLKK